MFTKKRYKAQTRNLTPRKPILTELYFSTTAAQNFSILTFGGHEQLPEIIPNTESAGI